MRLPNTLICLDIETTGTTADRHSIIQIGALAIRPDLSTASTFNRLIRPVPGDKWDRRAEEVHSISQERLEAEGLPYYDALAYFYDWAHKATGDSRPMLASWGTYFDIAFLRAFHARVGLRWNYQRKCIDLKSIAYWEMAKRESGIGIDGFGVEGTLQALGMKFEGKPHDGFDDIVNTMRIIRAFDTCECVCHGVGMFNSCEFCACKKDPAKDNATL